MERSGRGAGTQPRCEAVTQRGTPCRSFALAGRPWCMAHDPERASTVRTARAKGGATASKLRMLRSRRAKLDTVAALVGFTAGIIHDVVEHVLPYETGRVVLYGVSIQRQLLETGDLERRLAALEEQARAAGPSGRRHGW